MPGFNGSGTFVRTYNWVTDKGNGVKITASRMDTEDDGLATGLSTCLTKDGQTTATARIPFAVGIGLADGTVSAPAVSFTGDTNTGFYRIGADNIGLALGGSKIIDFAATLVAITSGTALSVLDTTASSSTTTGALKVAGGLGVAGAFYAGATSTIGTGATVTLNVNGSSSGSSGGAALIVQNGGVSSGYFGNYSFFATAAYSTKQLLSGIGTLALSGGFATASAIEISATNGLGFFGTTPAARPTGVAVTAAGIHAALVTLGLITA
jgi:hypothetical protein